MKRATKKFFVVFLAVLSVFLLVVNAYAKEPYKIGALFAVTGPASFLGEPEKNTAIMLQEQINKAGGINGHPLKLLLRTQKVTRHRPSSPPKNFLKMIRCLPLSGRPLPANQWPLFLY